MKTLTYSLLCAGLACAAVACGDNAQEAAVPVELFSWWTGPGEARALQALVDVNEIRHPRDRVFNSALDSGDAARETLAARLAADDPPDLFQQSVRELPEFLANAPDSLQSLDELFAAQGLSTALAPDVLASVTVSGHVYAVPVGIHRENALFYSKQIFSEQHLNPPTTQADFLATCATLKAAGVTPIAVGYRDRSLRLLFDALAMGAMGVDAYHEFMTGGARDDDAFRAAIGVFSEVLANFVNADAAELDWRGASESVFAGRAAMLLQGDWAKGYYVELGWTPGIDFGVLGAPGASKLFWYDVDAFSLPAGAPHPAGAEDFLATTGSVDGQLAFNKLKGSTPVRPDVTRARLDSEGRIMLDAFQNATYRTLAVSSEVWDAALLAFATTRDEQALFQAYVDHPPPVGALEARR